jgi:hypothetical protein
MSQFFESATVEEIADTEQPTDQFTTVVCSTEVTELNIKLILQGSKDK